MDDSLDYDEFSIKERQRAEESVQLEIAVWFGIAYNRLKDKWMFAFDKWGAIAGWNGRCLINKVIAYYEKQDTVKGYERCALLMKLLAEYNQRYPVRHG